MQNKVVRFILDLDSRTHIGQSELDKLRFLNVEDRVKQLKLNHVFKIYHNMSPDYLRENFKKTSEVHRYNTRGSHFNFIIPKVRGQYGSNTFQFTAVKEWNSLPSHIKSIDIFSGFKIEVKSYLAQLARQREGSVP